MVTNALQCTHHPHDIERAPDLPYVLHHESDALTLNRFVLVIDNTVPTRDVKGTTCIQPGEGIVGWVVEHGEPIIAPRVNDDPRFSKRLDDVTKKETRSIVCVPVKGRDKVLGAIELINFADELKFNDDDLFRLNALADFAAARDLRPSDARAVYHYGLALARLDRPGTFRLAAVNRFGKAVVVDDTLIGQEGDTLVFVAATDALDELGAHIERGGEA